jgi:HK97 family phage major capsid protein
MAASIDFSGTIPPTTAREIIAIAEEKSAALALARKVPMPTGAAEVPVQTGVPVAGWVAQAGGRKPFTDLTVGMVSMKAEEVAAVISIPQQYLDDSSINLWNFARPQIASAIALALDQAVLWGVNAPASFPVGGVTAAAYCQTATTVAGDDAATRTNNAMALVEKEGLAVSGHVADVTVQAKLRNIRDNMGAFLLGPSAVQNSGLQSFWGYPIMWDQFPPAETENFITGAWDALQIGVRQDITYAISDQAVIADGAGTVLVSAFQDNCVILKAHARFGALITKPPTQKVPGGAKPFANVVLA